MDLRGDDDNVAGKAWSEIQARLSNGALSLSRDSRLMDAFLDEQARPEVRFPITGEMVNMLGDATIESAMTSEQQRRYARSLARDITLSIRPRVAADEPFQIVFSWDSRVPLNRTCMLRLISFTCNNREVEGNVHTGGGSGCGGIGSGIEHRLAESGQAVFKAVVRAELFDTFQQSRDGKPPRFVSDPIELTAVTEVLPA